MPEREDGAKSAVPAPESPVHRQLRLRQEQQLAEAKAAQIASGGESRIVEDLSGSIKPETMDALLEELVLRRNEEPTEEESEDYPKDRAELASEAGFKGTLAEFLDWLEESLVYGGMRRLPDTPDEYRPGKKVLRIELFTGGFSSDEHLLGRVFTSPYTRSAWRSMHAGGLYVYEFNDSWQDSDKEYQWLQPELGDPFETLGRARKIRVVSASGKEVQILEGYRTGIELLFTEEGSAPGSHPDINNPAGVLTIQPIPEERSYWK